jgi:hypothetical protein
LDVWAVQERPKGLAHRPQPAMMVLHCQLTFAFQTITVSSKLKLFFLLPTAPFFSRSTGTILIYPTLVVVLLGVIISNALRQKIIDVKSDVSLNNLLTKGI